MTNSHYIVRSDSWLSRRTSTCTCVTCIWWHSTIITSSRSAMASWETSAPALRHASKSCNIWPRPIAWSARDSWRLSASRLMEWLNLMETSRWSSTTYLMGSVSQLQFRPRTSPSWTKALSICALISSNWPSNASTKSWTPWNWSFRPRIKTRSTSSPPI